MKSGKSSLRWMLACFSLLVTNCPLNSASAQVNPCFGILQSPMPICTPPVADYDDGSYSAWFNSIPSVPSALRCVYQADDGEVSFSPNFVKPGRTVVLEWTPETFEQSLSWPLWQEQNGPVGSTIAIQALRTLPSGCGAPPSYTLQRQPIPGADCTGNRCNFVMLNPFGTFAPGYYNAIIDYRGLFNSIEIPGRMYVPIYVAENQLPVADFSAQRIDGLRYLMSAATSTDDEALVEFQWDIGGVVEPLDPRSRQIQFEVEFPAPGEYYVKLIVEDADGEFSVKERTIQITDDGTSPADPELSVAALTARVSVIKQSLQQVTRKPSKRTAAAQRELRSQIKNAVIELQNLVNANANSIATKSSRTDLRKLVKGIKGGANRTLRRLGTFKKDRKDVVKRLNQFLGALA